MQDDFVMNAGSILVPASQLRVGGKFIAQLVREGEVIDEWEQPNLVVNEGLNSLLNVYLNGASPFGSWYLGIFEGNYTPVATDTAATIAGNSTESTAYTAATRPQWNPAAASGQAITNSANRATFTFNATKTIYGAFLISSPTISGTTGTLFSAARFATAKNVVNLDQLLLTYTFSASSV
jgi:hypothetical protein